MNPTNIVVGVFQNEAQARKAIDELKSLGLGYDQIGVASHENGAPNPNLANDLTTLGVAQDRASYYDNEFRNGRTVVSVRPDGRDAEVARVLQNNGAYDYGRDTTATNYTSTTNTGDTDSANYNRADYAQTGTYAQTNTTANDLVDDTDQAHSLRLREEQLQATKQRVQAGEVELRKEVVSEQKTINVPVTHEEVVIEQHSVSGGQIDNTPIGQDEVINVPVSEERVDVTKTSVVTGEVAIGKRAVQETQQVSDTVRREEAHVENPDNAIIHDTENDIYHRNQNNPNNPDNL